MRTFNNIHEAYKSILKEVIDEPEYVCSPRGLAIKEITDYTFRVLEPVSETIVTEDVERNKTIASYTEKETLLYDSCTNAVEDFVEASKFWGHLANPDGTINSAYGYLIWKNRSHGNGDYEYNKPVWGAECLRTPWEWARECLTADKDTRQALLRFSLPEHQWMGNKDQTCTMHGIFLIRENKLNLSITMRSNDLMKGLVYDLPWFVSLIDKMVEDLKPVYPDLEKGHYTHTVHSMHIYEKDEPAIRKMIGE